MDARPKDLLAAMACVLMALGAAAALPMPAHAARPGALSVDGAQIDMRIPSFRWALCAATLSAWQS